MFYLPIGLIAWLVFVLIQLLVFWPTYFKILASKIRMQKWQTKDCELSMPTKTYLSWVAFIFAGPFLMTFRQIQDSIAFIGNLFKSVKMSDMKVDDGLSLLNHKNFEIVEEILDHFGGLTAKKNTPLKDILGLL